MYVIHTYIYLYIYYSVKRIYLTNIVYELTFLYISRV